MLVQTDAKESVRRRVLVVTELVVSGTSEIHPVHVRICFVTNQKCLSDSTIAALQSDGLDLLMGGMKRQTETTSKVRVRLHLLSTSSLL